MDPLIFVSHHLMMVAITDTDTDFLFTLTLLDRKSRFIKLIFPSISHNNLHCTTGKTTLGTLPTLYDKCMGSLTSPADHNN